MSAGAGGRRTGVLGIVTPEAVLLELDIADYASRLAARLIDLAVQLALFVTLALGAAALAENSDLSTTVLIAMTVVGTFGVLFVYPTVMEARSGATVGKRAVGLRVRTIDGGPIRFRHAAVRAALAVIEVFPGGMLATVSMLLDRRCRRLGDLAGGTVVVREKGALGGTTAVWFPIPPGWETYAASLAVANLDESQYEVIRTFLLRATGLSTEARTALSTRLATQVGRRVGVAPAPGCPTELWLSVVAGAWQRSRR